MISRDLKLTINNNKASLNEPVTIYTHDRGILLNITVKEYKFKTGYITEANILEEYKGIYKAVSVIKSPDGKIFKYPTVKTEIINDIVKILINKDWTDEEDEIGKYYIQIQLFDDSGSRVSLPPFYITLEKSIFPYDDEETANYYAFTDVSEFDTSLVGYVLDDEDNSNILEGFYDKTEWKENSLISEDLLKKIENRLDDVYSGKGIKKTKISNLNTNSKTTVGAINELKALIKALKDEMDDYIDGLPLGGGDSSQDVLISSVEIDDVLLTMDLYDTKKINYSITPEINSDYLIWRSTDENVAVVRNGVVIATGVGTTAITCESYKNSLCETSSVTIKVVENIPIERIKLNKTSINQAKINTIHIIDATVYPTNATSTDIEWYSTNAEAVTLNIVNNGRRAIVTILSNQETDIVVRLESDHTVNSKCHVIPIVPIESIELELNSISLNKGDNFKINYELMPENTTERNVQWHSSNSCVTVDNEGNITVTDKGTATVVCRSSERNEIYAECTIDCNIPLERVEIRQSSINLMEEENIELIADLYPSDTTENELIWEVEDDFIAYTVNSNTLYGFNKGTTNISCRSKYNSDITDSCQVIVKSYDILIRSYGGSGILVNGENVYAQDKMILLHHDEETGLKTLGYIHESDTKIESIQFIDHDIYEVIKLNTTYIKDFSSMFENCISLTSFTDYINTYFAENMQAMFKGCEHLVNFPNLETINVTKMDSICEGCTSLEYVPPLDTRKVTSMNKAFKDCISLNPIPELETDSMREMSYAFQNCSAMTGIADSEKYWNNEKIISFGMAFEGCTSLENFDLIPKGWGGNLSPVEDIDITGLDEIETFEEVYPLHIEVSSESDNCNDIKWEVSDDTVAVINIVDDYNVEVVRQNYYQPVIVTCSSRSNENIKDSVTITFLPNEKTIIFISDESPSIKVNNVARDEYVKLLKENEDNTKTYAYEHSESVQKVDFSSNEDLKELIYIDTSCITDMSHMFNGCNKLVQLDLSNWNTANVTDMSYMFSGCYELETVTGLRNLNTDSVKDMSYLFSSCNNLTNINDVEYWNVSSVTSMISMFESCFYLETLNTVNWSTGNVTNMDNMFTGCNLSVIPDLDTTNVTSMNGMFAFNSAMTGYAKPNSYWSKTPAVVNYGSCFMSCTKLTNYSAIPSGWK